MDAKARQQFFNDIQLFALPLENNNDSAINKQINVIPATITYANWGVVTLDPFLSVEELIVP